MTPQDDPEVTRQREAFVDACCEALAIDRATIAEVTPRLLGMVSRVAHGAARPAGPIAAMLVGMAAARASDTAEDATPTPEALEQAMHQVVELVAGWERDQR